MEPVEIYIKREIFNRQALRSIALTVAASGCMLYIYLLLGTIDFLHPAQFIYDFFGGLLPALLYWILCSFLIAVTLAYRATFFKVVNEKLSCPADSLSLVLNKTALLQATAHFISSLLLSWVLTSMIGGRYADLIIYCDEQESRCLNEHKWFVVFFSAVVGSACLVEASALGKTTLQFSNDESPIFGKLKDDLPVLLKAATRATRRAFLVYYPLYFIIGGVSSRVVRLFLFLNDHEDVGLKSIWNALDLTLLYQTYIAGVFVRLTWEISLYLFQAFMTKHVKFELKENRGESSLLSAMELKRDNLTKYLGYKDLACVAQTVGDSRRSVVYNLSLPGGHPKTWNSVLSSTTAELNDLLSRLENQNEKLVSAYKGILSHQATKIETLKPGYSTSKTASVSQVAKGKPWYHPTILYKQYSDHLSAEIFYDTQKHLWALQALSSLVTRSFSDDKYGVVQQNLGQIVTLIIKLQKAVENLFRTAPILGRKPDDMDVNKQSHELALQLRYQLKSSLESIAITFHPHISHIVGMSVEHSKILESFVH